MAPPRGLLGRIGRFASWAVLVSGVALSVFVWFFTRSGIEHEARSKFQATTVAIAADAQTHIRSYADLLYGLQGFFQAQPVVTRGAFDRYVYGLDLPVRYPSVRSVSYVHRVPAAARTRFEKQLSQDPELRRRGYPSQVIKPDGERPEHLVLTYIEPLHTNKSELGFDLASDEKHLSLVARARDSGMPTLSERFAPATDPDSSDAEVVMRLALFRRDAFTPDVERRREAFSGLANVTLSVTLLARHMLYGEGYEKLTLSIHDTGFIDSNPRMQPQELYSNAALRPEATGTVLTDSHYVDIGQRRWELKFSAPQSQFLRASDDVLPWAALSAVLAATLMLSGLISSLSGSRDRARALAEKMTADLYQSQANLAEEKRRTQELIEVMPNPIFFKDTDGRYLGVNRAWEKFFGLSRDEFIGKTVFDLYPDDPQLAARLHADDQVIWDHPGTKSYETMVTTRDGQSHAVVYYKATFTAADGRVAGLIGNIVDVTERKRAEAGRARLAAIVENSGDAIMSRSLDHKILTWNAAAERMFGYADHEVVGQDTALLIPPELLDQTKEQWAGFKDHVVIPVYDAVRLTKDGRRIDVSIMQSEINDPGGKLIGMSVAYRDISARKQAEKRLAMEHAVTRVLARAETVAEAIPEIVRTICESLGWVCGALWRWDEKAEVLRRAETWHADIPDVAEFMVTTSGSVYEAPARRDEASGTRTEGLLRRVWMEGTPVWVPDVTQVPGFRRGMAAAKAGFHCAFGFPVTAGAGPLGVMEFYSRDAVKPDEPLLEIVQAIGSQIGQFLQRKEAEERIRHVATHDSLTSLPNRVMFSQLLNLAIPHARRHDHHIAVLFIDLDRFKIINDTLGHDAGDRLLQVVAKRFTDCLRESDIVARLGGDEFVVLLQEVGDVEQVAAVARKILDAAIEPVVLLGEECRVTASIGISMYPADANDEQSLMKHADGAMYRAKEEGKNNFQFYSETIKSQSEERKALETSLRYALERNELLLHYQAKLDLRTQEIVGVEALLRWQHPDLGTVAPMRFIPIAEETGLILAIGRWVLKTACAQNVAWQQEGLSPVSVAVNLTPRQFGDEDLHRDIAAALEQSGMRPDLLEFEITEEMVMQNPERAIKVLAGIKQMGVRIAIGNFGGGFSSFAQIKNFAIDTLKVDRSFTQNLLKNVEHQAVTKAIIAMGKALSVTVVAEGIETQEQLAFLSDHACDAMQGYYFNEPLTPDEIADFIRQHRVRAAGPG